MQARPCGKVCVAACVCTCAGGRPLWPWGEPPACTGPPSWSWGGRPWPPPWVWGSGPAALPCCPLSSWRLGSATPGSAPSRSALGLASGSFPVFVPGSIPPVPAVGLCDPAHPPGPSPHLRCLCGPPAAHRASPPEAELPEAPQARLIVSAPQIRQGWRRGWTDERTHLCLAGMSLRKQGRQFGAQEGPCSASLPTLHRKAFLGTTSKCRPVLWLACLPTLHTQRPSLRELEVYSAKVTRAQIFDY